jgi:hypothetical protein
MNTTKVKLAVFFLMIANHPYAQTADLRSPTKFDKFITDSKIKWAAYVNDKMSFDKYNLAGELYKRFQNGEIKITSPISRDSLMAGSKIIYLNKNDLELRSFAPGNYQKQARPTNRVDSNSSKINIEEILYVKNGKLYSYIPWVSPLISIYTSRDYFIGTSEYFSSCINTKYNFKSSKRDDLIFMGSTKRKILIDSLPGRDMLKQLYGINMLEAIWSYVMNDNNEITDLNNGEKVTASNLKSVAYANSITIPVYDSLGRITAQQTYSEPISPSLFQQIEITQDWYYDRNKNIVVNNIPDITLFIRSKSNNDYGVLKPVLKITFK